ncbi:MAG: hypothetical protein HC914_07715 [Chloroflexaceae bacterium]|nr:hypothetical protein [Chloroflexaceae bacterium]
MLLVWPVAAVAGPVAAYGVAAILGFALSGFITYLLGLRVVGSVAGALAAGMMVTIAPKHIDHFVNGHLEHVTLQWLALYVLVLHHATEHPRRVRGCGLRSVRRW